MANFTPQQIEEFLREFFDVVGTRQYVGARYVPIFGRAGETSIAWDNSQPYEPLTIVMYQGNSFTSRQYVPAGVDILDGEYWANTGNYNSQIEQYRQEVIRLESDWDDWKTDTLGDLDDWKTDTLGDLDEWRQDTLEDIDTEIANVQKCAIYVGNSFTMGTGSTTGDRGIFALTKDFLFDEAEMVARSGAGFYQYDGDHDYDFASMLIAKAQSMTQHERNKITHVIAVSAIGDDRVVRNNSYNTTNLETGLLNFANAIANNFANAKGYVYLATCSLSNNDGQCNSATTSILHEAFKRRCPQNNLVYLGWGGYVNMHRNPELFAADHYHPADPGYKFLATNLIAGFNGGIKYPINFVTAVELTCVEDNTKKLYANIEQHEDFIVVTIANDTLSFATDGSYTFRGNVDNITAPILALARTTEVSYNTLFRFRPSSPQIDLRPCIMGFTPIPNSATDYTCELSLYMTGVVGNNEARGIWVMPVILRAGLYN